MNGFIKGAGFAFGIALLATWDRNVEEDKRRIPQGISCQNVSEHFEIISNSSSRSEVIMSLETAERCLRQMPDI